MSATARLLAAPSTAAANHRQGLIMRFSTVVLSAPFALVLAACERAPVADTAGTPGGRNVPSAAGAPTGAVANQVPANAPWLGTYAGTVPCASCPGIDTQLTLAGDGSYVLKETYRESGEAPSEERGRYAHDAQRAEIALDSAGDARRYRIEAGALRQLQLDGEPVSGTMAELYVLRRAR